MGLLGIVCTARAASRVVLHARLARDGLHLWVWYLRRIGDEFLPALRRAVIWKARTVRAMRGNSGYRGLEKALWVNNAMGTLCGVCVCSARPICHPHWALLPV